MVGGPSHAKLDFDDLNVADDVVDDDDDDECDPSCKVE